MNCVEEPSLLVLTNSEFVLVDTDLLPELSQYNWHPSGDEGYAARTIGGHSEVELLHRRINQTPKGKQTDHVNGFRRDNRRSNLRTASNFQNSCNRTKGDRKTSSKYKGVWFDLSRSKWSAMLQIDKKRVFLGRFETESDAAKAYNRAALRLFGDFAKLNSIDNYEI